MDTLYTPAVFTEDEFSFPFTPSVESFPDGSHDIFAIRSTSEEQARLSLLPWPTSMANSSSSDIVESLVPEPEFYNPSIQETFYVPQSPDDTLGQILTPCGWNTQSLPLETGGLSACNPIMQGLPFEGYGGILEANSQPNFDYSYTNPELPYVPSMNFDFAPEIQDAFVYETMGWSQECHAVLDNLTPVTVGQMY
jgi:hypothetical protein